MKTTTEKPKAEGDFSPADCSPLPFSLRLGAAVVALEAMEDDARGPGGHEVFMNLHRATQQLRRALYHQEIREANA